MTSSASLKYGSLFGEDDPATLRELTGSAAARPKPSGAYVSLFAKDIPDIAQESKKKFPGLFDDDLDFSPKPNAPSVQHDVYQKPDTSKKHVIPNKDLFADDTADTDSAVPPGPKAEDSLPIPPPPPDRRAFERVAVADPLAGDDEDESMFEMKYYEERARRVTLEARVRELERTVSGLERQLCEATAIAMSSDASSAIDIVQETACAEPQESAQKPSDASPEDINVGLGMSAEERLAAEEQRRQAALERRQRHQRRPVSTSARRLHTHSVPRGLPPVSSGGNLADLLPPVEGAAPLPATPSGRPISSVLTWSSDEDESEGAVPALSAPAIVMPAAALPTDCAEGEAAPEDTSAALGADADAAAAAQDEALSRRRQKAYRAAMGATPTSRRLGNTRIMTRAAGASKALSEQSSAESSGGARRKASLGGYEKWSDSEESDAGGDQQRAEKRKSREDSFQWDSDTEETAPAPPDAADTPAGAISVTDEESADRRVVAWARGKDIISMIRTFCDIYEDAQSLPEAVMYPQIQNASDVRKAYLKIVKYCHPDKQSKLGGMKHVAPKLFAALTDAYNDFRSQT